MAESENVVPLRAGEGVEAERTRQLLEFVAECLIEFVHATGEEPLDIALVIGGESGVTTVNHLVESRFRAFTCYAGNRLIDYGLNTD